MRYGGLTDLVRLAVQMQGCTGGLSLADIGQTFQASRLFFTLTEDAICGSKTKDFVRLGDHRRFRVHAGYDVEFSFGFV